MAAVTFEQLLDSLTVEGELYERLEDNAVRCYACGHRCLVKEGRRGICKVRFNDGGRLKVPWGYVGALQCDPTEKKPFFHIYPGSDTLTFGMLGCDFHCSYCLPPGARIATEEGPKRIEDLFAGSQSHRVSGPDEVRLPARSILVYSHAGQARRVEKLFRHPYQGRMIRVQPRYLPALECTPEHELLVGEPGIAPRFVRADSLSARDLLAVPRQFTFSRPTEIKTADLLCPSVQPYRTRRTISRETLEQVQRLSVEGWSSREIGERIGKTASHVRHLRSNLNAGKWNLDRLGKVTAPLGIEDDQVRLPKEHRPGIPLALALDSRLAALLGYYCAGGCVVRLKDRVHSATLNFSFGHHEDAPAEEVIELLEAVFGVRAARVRRETTIGIAVGKASVALCFEALCGSHSRAKRVPALLYQAPREVAEAFLRAYARGDGSTRANGLTQIYTVSEELAHGVAWLALKLGLLPSVLSYSTEPRPILGREVNSAPRQYAVHWYFDGRQRKFAREDDEYWYVPLRGIESFDYEGPVFNLQVGGEHSYLANLVATHNCQNWVTSQALRDSASEQSGAYPRPMSARQMVEYGAGMGAALVGSSYNEPLITSEWAVAVFKEATQAGLQCVYISNGNATRETLEYLRPYLTGYKIDLKSMSDRNYRKLGGVLQNTLDSIRLVQAMGIWLEVVTLTIPGFNDSTEELMEAARYLASISPDIPWHVTAFHKDYRMTEPDNTTVRTLIRAAEIGMEAGLRYVYAGNLPGQVGEFENTYCPNCRHLLIERLGYVILDYRITNEGNCPNCSTPIAGIWPRSRGEVRLGTEFDLYRRVPRPVVRARSDTFRP